MFNLNEIKKESVLDDLFECREENLCALTESDKRKIERLTKNNDSYDKLFNLILSFTLKRDKKCLKASNYSSFKA